MTKYLWRVDYAFDGEVRHAWLTTNDQNSDDFYKHLHPSLRHKYVDCEMVAANV